MTRRKNRGKQRANAAPHVIDRGQSTLSERSAIEPSKVARTLLILMSFLSPLWTTIFTFIGVLATVAGLVWTLHEIYYWLKPPDVDLHSLRIYFVEIDKNTYQLGLVAELANRDAKTYRIDGMTAHPTSIDVAGRGQNYIRKIWGDVDGHTTNDHHLEANKDAFFRMKLPLKFEMIVAHPPPPEILFFGEWLLLINGKPRAAVPRMIGNADETISESDWNALLDRPEYLQRVRLKEAPAYTEFKGPYRNYLLFNSDPTAPLDLYAFDNTQIVKSRTGQMTFVRGYGVPSLPSHWAILGHTYQEVWSDPQKLAIYNSIYPPAQDGRPRPFGVFAGAQSEMGVLESVATTRGRDILRIFSNADDPNQRAVNLDLQAGIRPIKEPLSR